MNPLTMNSTVGEEIHTGIFTCSEFSDSDNIIIIFYLITTTVFTFMFACTCFSPGV